MSLEFNDSTDLKPQAFLQLLQKLEVSNNQVNSLKGIESLSVFTELSAASPNVDAGERSLGVGHNTYNNIEALRELTALYDVEITSSEAEDITPLARHSNLCRFFSKGTHVTDVTSLDVLKQQQQRQQQRDSDGGQIGLLISFNDLGSRHFQTSVSGAGSCSTRRRSSSAARSTKPFRGTPSSSKVASNFSLSRRSSAV